MTLLPSSTILLYPCKAILFYLLQFLFLLCSFCFFVWIVKKKHVNFFCKPISPIYIFYEETKIFSGILWLSDRIRKISRLRKFTRIKLFQIKLRLLTFLTEHANCTHQLCGKILMYHLTLSRVFSTHQALGSKEALIDV